MPDGKEPGALRTIGELSAMLGVKQHVLRYWEQQFPTLRPLKRSGGRRYYRPEDVALVTRIDALVNRDGYTIKGARAALSQGPNADDTPVAAPAPDTAEIVADADEVLASLRAIRDRLATALAY
ncbi:MerR family transcriptional regulator [Croceibacterium sp. TMG7-5b_MA50]|uniref:MerR family transcriptional regulator n=1 Tax=Croceibacterium sp. TMG7-5b_MA50 TaxID=3121290 RepID=UPI003221B76D